MLKHIAIRDYAIVDAVELEFDAGMTVITGETGAGKSIMLDAMGLCLGDRADARTVKPGAARADISVTFDLTALPAASAWLAARDLQTAEEECILRRTVTTEGRSRAYINGAPATLADCGELGALLVDIHSQHAHQSLLKSATQREILDRFAGADAIALEVGGLATRHREISQRYEALTQQSDDAAARRELLNYQVDELDTLGLVANEVSELESEQRALANAGFLIESAGQAAEACEQQHDRLSQLQQLIQDPRHEGKLVDNIRELLSGAQIQLDEAHGDLQRYAESLEVDPERLQSVENRLTSIYELARKHRVMPEQLTDHHEALRAELDNLTVDDASLAAMAREIDAISDDYVKAAASLSKKRQKAAKKLAKETMAALARLAMDRCTVAVELSPRDTKEHHPHGCEEIAFLISTNPGSAPGPLAKIASGGELSRISLALQVTAAEAVTVPTMIFDEVDVGIGGAVAEAVGIMLQTLAAQRQIFCVTHLPQVASQGNHHLQVSKGGDELRVTTEISRLESESRVEEIARMLGGLNVTDNTIAHAREMLKLSA